MPVSLAMGFSMVTRRWMVFAGLCWASVAPAAALQCLVDAGRTQIGVTTRYDPAYVRLDYPNGDVPIDRGVCTDVVIRAYRAIGIDLQQAVHEDMRAHFGSYPQKWGLRAADSNIDHRRVPNLAQYFTRHGESLGTSDDDASYQPGDLVTWQLPSGVPHIGIVSDRHTVSGTPLVIHNIGLGTREDAVLRDFKITGHYRFRPEGLVSACTSAP